MGRKGSRPTLQLVQSLFSFATWREQAAVQPRARWQAARRPSVCARAHGSAVGKRSLALQRQPRGLRGARASLPSPDLLNPSFGVGQVGRGSWALAFGSRWRGGHPAACPAPGRLRTAQLGRPRGEERGLWFAALSLLRGVRVRIGLPGDGGAVCRVPSVLWLLLLAQIYIPFLRFTPQGAGRF